MTNQARNSGPFSDIVAGLPGGVYIGEQWRTEPRALLHISGRDHRALSAALDEFPHATVPDSSYYFDTCHILCVPNFVVDVLTQMADGKNSGLSDIERHPFDGEGSDPLLARLGAEHVVDLVAWSCAASLVGYFDDAVSYASDIAEIALRHRVGWETIRELGGGPDDLDLEAVDDILAAAYSDIDSAA